MIGRGVAYRKTDETDLCWSTTVETGVLFIGRGVAYRKTGLHGTLFLSTVDPSRLHGLLFIHRRPPPASTYDFSSTGSCSSSLHRSYRLLFNQPSMGSSCSSSPPRCPVHPPPTDSIDRGPVHPAAMASTTTGSYPFNPHRELFNQTPSNAHGSSRGSIDRFQLAAVAKKSLDRVQLTAIDRSLGFSHSGLVRAQRLARV